jgi:hypothetical protein
VTNRFNGQIGAQPQRQQHTGDGPDTDLPRGATENPHEQPARTGAEGGADADLAPPAGHGEDMSA